MNPSVLLAVIFLCVGVSAAVFATLLGFMMIGEINRKREDDNQIPYFSFSPLESLKRLGLPRQYHRLYPHGRLHIYFFVAFAVMIIGAFGVFFSLYHMASTSPPIPRGR